MPQTRQVGRSPCGFGILLLSYWRVRSGPALQICDRTHSKLWGTVAVAKA